jgi:hypothetical protein
MLSKIVRFLIVIGILVIWTGQSSSQNINLGIHFGASKQYGHFSEYFHTSQHISGNIHGYLSQNILFGLNISFVDWSLVEGNDIESLSYGSHWTTLGKGSIFEITPSLKFQTNGFCNEKLQSFGLLGLGLYHICYDVEHYDPWLVKDPNASSYFGREHVYLQFDHYEIGLLAGLGILLNIFGKMYMEIGSQFRTIFFEKSAIEYVSLNLGFCIKY